MSGTEPWFERVLPTSHALRGMAVLAGGTGLAQLILILATPVLTRLYGPEDFGVLAVFLAVSGLALVVASLRMEVAIPLPNRGGAAIQLLGLSALSVPTVAILSGLLVGALCKSRWTPLGEICHSTYLGLLVVGIVIGGAYEALTYWSVRSRAHGVIVRTRIQQGGATVLLQALLGLGGLGASGLVIGQIIGQATGVLTLIGKVRLDLRRPGVGLSRRGMAWAAKRYRRFALLDTWAALINSASAQVPSLLLAAYGGVQLAGFYLLSIRLLSLPVSLLGKAAAQVLLPVVAERRLDGRLPELVGRAQELLCTAAMVPFAIFACLAPLTFGLLFGSDWSDAGSIAAWTAVWVAWQLVYSPLSVVLLGLEAQGTHLRFQIAAFGLRVSALVIGFTLGNSEAAVAAFSIASALAYVLGLATVARCAGLSLARSLAELLRQVSTATLVVLPTLVAAVWGHRWTVYIAAAVSLLCWGLWMARALRRLEIT